MFKQLRLTTGREVTIRFITAKSTGGIRLLVDHDIPVERKRTVNAGTGEMSVTMETKLSAAEKAEIVKSVKATTTLLDADV